MQDFEKLGMFYLGKEYNLETKTPHEQLVMYDAKDLTTHAVCVGMTGSGKTGLCLTLLEEAAIDGIPVIAIDPKGDLGNLLLTFPDLKPADFQPWLDPQDALRKGLTVEQLADKTAKTWKDGLAAWGQTGERITRFRDAVDIAIYTPGSKSGIPLTVIRSFAAPGSEIMNDGDAFRERVNGAVSGLLALLDVEGDPLRSREHILLATLVERSWRDGKELDLGALIRGIQTPGFTKIGVLDLESFFPAQERFELAMRLNNLLASPGFSAWMEGEPLDVQRLLHAPNGKPRLSIMSIAHLSDSERMFFVTVLLNEIISWMRRQSGTSSLRAILYMDEVFGFFPPTANPPSKVPMLTLLKQARAFGLGVMLATQNPVDLDYKGLSNCGTWFLGRLQTERDKMRVLDGLEGASTSAGHHFDRAKMEATLSGLGNRVFLMNDVHLDEPIVFQTRWALSFLRGPLSREQVSKLMETRKAATASLSAPTAAATSTITGMALHDRPVLPPGISELFLTPNEIPSGDERLAYRPAILASAKVHFSQATLAIDVWHSVSLLMPVDGDLPGDLWDSAPVVHDAEPDLSDTPESEAAFTDLPAELTQPKRYATLTTALKDSLYRTQRLKVWKCPKLKKNSLPDESEGDFRVRMTEIVHEQRDLQIEKLRAKYAPKLATIQEQLRKAVQRVEKEQAQSKQQWIGAGLNVLTTAVGAMFGRRLGTASNVTKIVTTARSAGRIAQERGDIAHATETVEAIQVKLDALNTEVEAEVEKIREANDPDQIPFEEVILQPKKTDISVPRIALVWTPWITTPQGDATAAFTFEDA